MASLSETIQQIITSIAGLFGRKKGLDSLSKDELQKEQRILEQNEYKITRKIEQLEAQKTRLFEEARREPSESVRRAKARQIRDIDQRIRSLQSTLTPLGKRLSVLDSLIAQHEMGNFAPGTSQVVDALRQTDAQQIQKNIDNQLVEDLVQEGKLDDMTETFKTAREREDAMYEEDEEIQAILSQIEQSAVMDADTEESAFLKETHHDTESPSGQAMPETE